MTPGIAFSAETRGAIRGSTGFSVQGLRSGRRTSSTKSETRLRNVSVQVVLLFPLIPINLDAFRLCRLRCSRAGPG